VRAEADACRHRTLRYLSDVSSRRQLHYTPCALWLFFLAASTLSSCGGRANEQGWIAFASQRHGNYDIFIMKGNGTATVRVTQESADEFSPAFSPSGQRIAFVARDRGLFQIFTVNRDGSNLAKISDGTAHDTAPSWSPDGYRIAFVSARQDQSLLIQQVYVMNADGSGVQQLSHGPDEAPVWSPDGRRILFVRRFALYTMDADGSNARALVDLGRTLEPTSATFGAWAPDSRTIAFVQDGALHLTDIDGSTPKRVRTGNVRVADAPIAWSPDGKNLAFSAEGGLYAVGTDGRNLRHLGTTQNGDGAPNWIKSKRR